MVTFHHYGHLCGMHAAIVDELAPLVFLVLPTDDAKMLPMIPAVVAVLVGRVAVVGVAHKHHRRFLLVLLVLLELLLVLMALLFVLRWCRNGVAVLFLLYCHRCVPVRHAVRFRAINSVRWLLAEP